MGLKYERYKNDIFRSNITRKNIVTFDDESYILEKRFPTVLTDIIDADFPFESGVISEKNLVYDSKHIKAFKEYLISIFGKNEIYLNRLFEGILPNYYSSSTNYYYLKNDEKIPLDLNYFESNSRYPDQFNDLFFLNMVSLGIDLKEVGKFAFDKKKGPFNSLASVLAISILGERRVENYAADLINRTLNRSKRVSVEINSLEGRVRLIYEKEFSPIKIITPNGVEVKPICDYNLGSYHGGSELLGKTVINSSEIDCHLEGNHQCVMRFEYKKENLNLNSVISKFKKELIRLLFPNFYKNTLELEDRVVIMSQNFLETSQSLETYSKELQRRNDEIQNNYSILEIFTPPGGNIKDLIKNGEDPINLESKLVNRFVFFSDIRGFTNFAERMSPIDLVNSLNENFFIPGEKIILNNKGEIWGLLGDCIYFSFEDRENAFKSIIELDKWFIERNFFRIGIGGTYGVVNLANIGDKQKFMQRTLIGDIVNTASRIENLNKDYGSRILVSSNSFFPKEEFKNSRLIALTSIRGKSDTKELVEIFQNDSEQLIEFKFNTKKEFEEIVKKPEENRDLIDNLRNMANRENIEDLGLEYYVKKYLLTK